MEFFNNRLLKKPQWEKASYRRKMWKKFKRTKNFTINELTASTTAERKGIDNRIPKKLENNAKRLLEFLQEIRDAWGSGIMITSGYRCPELNEAVNGSKTSAHQTCNAADIWPSNGKFAEFKKFMVEYLEDKLWDQCIIEKSGNSRWIHLGLYNNSGEQRQQIFKIEQ